MKSDTKNHNKLLISDIKALEKELLILKRMPYDTTEAISVVSTKLYDLKKQLTNR